MSKKVKTQDEFEAELKSEVPSFDGVAVTILKKDGGYNIVKIPVDTKTLKTGQAEIVDTAESKAEAADKFKILVVRSGVL